MSRGWAIVALFCVVATSCKETVKEEPPLSAEEQAKLMDVKVSQADVQVQGTSQGELRVKPEATISVSGKFKLENSDQVPLPIVAQPLEARGSRKISYSPAIVTAVKEGDHFSFEAQVTAPKRPGTYSFTVSEGSTVIAERSLVVSP